MLAAVMSGCVTELIIMSTKLVIHPREFLLVAGFILRSTQMYNYFCHILTNSCYGDVSITLTEDCAAAISHSHAYTI